MKIEINITEAEKNAIIDSLKQLEGLPPYDGFNSSKGDNYFAKSIELKYGYPISILQELVNFKSIKKDWEKTRENFIRESNK